jgi:serine/threonine protein kinase
LQGNIKEKYFFEKKLGSGGYGAVYLAKNKQSGEKVAIKAM